MAESTDARFPKWVRKIAGLDAGSKLTLESLWSFARWESDGPRVVWPTVGTVAAETNEPERTVQHRLAKLAELGWVRRTKAHGRDAWELAWCNPWPSDRNGLRSDTQPVAPAMGCGPTRNGLRSDTQPVAVEGCNGLHPEQSENDQEQPKKIQTRAPTREDVEAELLAMIIEHGVAGLAPGPTFVGCAVTQVMRGRCTTEQVEQITVEFIRRRRAGDKALRSWQDLFFGKNWTRTAQDYLGLDAKRSSPAALEDSQHAWGRKLELVVLQGGAPDVADTNATDNDAPPDWSRRGEGS